jgi:hypothetical protein
MDATQFSIFARSGYRPYEPSKQTISRKCAAIRSRWPDGEFARRAPHLVTPHVTIQVVHVSEEELPELDE